MDLGGPDSLDLGGPELSDSDLARQLVMLAETQPPPETPTKNPSGPVTDAEMQARMSQN